MQASKNGKFTVVEALVAAGADVYIVNQVRVSWDELIDDEWVGERQ